MLNLLSSLGPRARLVLEDVVILGVCVANVCNDCKLYATSQRKFFRIADPVSSLKNVSCPIASTSDCMYFFESVIHDGSQVGFGDLGKDLAYGTADVLLVLSISHRFTV